MNQDIGRMITVDLEVSPVIIQCKRKGGNGPVWGPRVGRVGRKGLLDLLPRCFGEVHCGVVSDIGPVVKMPGACQGIAVNGAYKQGQDDKGIEIFSAEKMRRFIMDV